MASSGFPAYRKHFKEHLYKHGDQMVADTQIMPNNAVLEKSFKSIHVGVGALFEVDNPDQQVRGLTLPEYSCVFFIGEPERDM